jgi:hypothetical protein
VDITTTAGYTPPITTCITYPDSAPADGVVDGTGISECDMRILHEEGASFIDVTPLATDSNCPTLAGTCEDASPRCIDTVNNRVCGVTSTLSPFAAVPLLPEAAVPALSPRGTLVLVAGLVLAGAAFLGAPPRRRRGTST